MEKIILDDQIVRRVLADALLRQDAEIFRGTTEQPFEVQVVDLDLSTARTPENPYRIGFPFKSVFIRDASDSVVNIDMQVQTKDTYQGKVTLKLNDSLVFGQQQSSGFLSWEAQSGKTMSLIFFVSAEFRSGSQVSQTAGGIAIIDGSSFSQSVVALAVATATAVVAQDTTRKQVLVVNETGSDIWLGASTVTNSGANRGFKVINGGVFTWRNTAALYGYSVGGGDVHLTQEF